MNYDKIGLFIQQRRKSKNLTQKQLANKIGVTDRAVSKWERGQGCPDVSLLEILSKELDCSILELLKGREIENEVISVTEADDYVKNSIRMAKYSFKKIINVLIIFIINIIFCLLSYLNIIHIYTINKTTTINIKDYYHNSLVNKDILVKNNLDIINKNKGIYTKSDYEQIKQLLNNSYNILKSNKMNNIITSEKEIKYKLNDIIYYSDNKGINLNIINVIDIIKKYDKEQLLNYYKEVLLNNISKNVMSYKTLIPYESYMYNTENKEMMFIIDNYIYDYSEILYITELVKEIGGIYE